MFGRFAAKKNIFWKKSDTKQLTVRDWKDALDALDLAYKDGTLVEATKNAPLPSF